MATTLLEKLVDRVPSAHRRFIRKQGDIAMQIWDILDRLGWTQRELAEKAGMKESFISRLLAGGGNPTLRTICNIEDALNEEILIAPKFLDHAQSTSISDLATLKIESEVAELITQTANSELYHIAGGQIRQNVNSFLPDNYRRAS